jgi:hypothetical protein
VNSTVNDPGVLATVIPVDPIPLLKVPSSFQIVATVESELKIARASPLVLYAEILKSTPSHDSGISETDTPVKSKDPSPSELVNDDRGVTMRLSPFEHAVV